MLWSRYLLHLLVAGVGFVAPQLEADPGLELKPFAAKFQVTRSNIPLGTLDLRLDLTADGGYNYTGHTKPGAIIRWLISDEVHESSRGTYADRQIVPLTYEFLQSNGEVKKKTLLKFDWKTEKVWTTSEGTRWSQKLSPGMHDKFSQQLALRLELSGGAKTASYPVADGGRIKTYYYKVEGSDSINLPYGRLNCLKVKRNKENHPPDYTIWFAPELDYLPVKIERKRSSGHYTIELMQLTESR
ncbi:MAG: DUF3108 domain-containing protein [Pseudomonadota bacterium]